ncbi:uncharacterized protein TNCV_1845091 [Trichonephila clavipes]|nr:uncharacterized protein TNCV_1845091 [Trichonephila clavipes]
MNHAIPYFALIEDVEFGEKPTKPCSILPYLQGARVWREYMIMFCRNGSDALVVLEDKSTATKYLDILADQVHPTMLHFYPDGDGYFIDSNAAIHRARSVQNWFAEHQSAFQHLPSPPHNPNLNPIANV